MNFKIFGKSYTCFDKPVVQIPVVVTVKLLNCYRSSF